MRVKGGIVKHQRRKKILKAAKGYFGSKHRIYRTAKEATMKALAYSYIGRRNKKRDFRKLWITRINAACRLNGTTYSAFINGLKKNNISLNRKMLSEIAISSPEEFAKLVEASKN